MLIYPAAGKISTSSPGGRRGGGGGVEGVKGSSPGSRANDIYSSGRDKLIEVQLYMSASC